MTRENLTLVCHVLPKWKRPDFPLPPEPVLEPWSDDHRVRSPTSSPYLGVDYPGTHKYLSHISVSFLASLLRDFSTLSDSVVPAEASDTDDLLRQYLSADT